jgi:hypothetical protein
MRGKGHEPPLTVLDEEAFPDVAEPVDSEVDPLLVGVADGVAVDVLVPLVDDIDVVDELFVVDDVPACVSAATTPSPATAIVPTTPNVAVSLWRRRSARSRSATVRRRFGEDMCPGWNPRICDRREDPVRSL